MRPITNQMFDRLARTAIDTVTRNADVQACSFAVSIDNSVPANPVHYCMMLDAEAAAVVEAALKQSGVKWSNLNVCSSDFKN